MGCYFLFRGSFVLAFIIKFVHIQCVALNQHSASGLYATQVTLLPVIVTVHNGPHAKPPFRSA